MYDLTNFEVCSYLCRLPTVQALGSHSRKNPKQKKMITKSESKLLRRNVDFRIFELQSLLIFKSTEAAEAMDSSVNVSTVNKIYFLLLRKVFKRIIIIFDRMILSLKKV